MYYINFAHSVQLTAKKLLQPETALAFVNFNSQQGATSRQLQPPHNRATVVVLVYSVRYRCGWITVSKQSCLVSTSHCISIFQDCKLILTRGKLRPNCCFPSLKLRKKDKTPELCRTSRRAFKRFSPTLYTACVRCSASRFVCV